MLQRVGLVQDTFLGLGGLLLCSFLHVHLGRQGLDGFAELLARLLNVGLEFVDIGIGGPDELGLAHPWRASFTSLMSALTLSTLSVAGGAISSACFRLRSAAMPASDEQHHGDDHRSGPDRQYERQRGHAGRDQGRQAED